MKCFSFCGTFAVVGAAVFAVAVASSAGALEAVVQADVGAGSAVAGSLNAVNSRADTLQANMVAANAVINQQNQKISATTDEVTNFKNCARQTPPATWDGTQCVSLAPINTVTQLQNTVVTMQSDMQNIITCNSQGKLWIGNQCVMAAVPSTGKNIVYTDCYEGAGGYGVHVTCAPNYVVTKVCSSGRDADCQGTYTRLTCCHLTAQ